MNNTARTWAEIDLGALRHNYHTLRKLLHPGAKFLGVVKADAYGHGAVPVAKALEEEGCDWLAAATLPEAAELRKAGICLPILILGRTEPECTEELLSLGITQTVSSTEDALRYSEYASRLGKRLPVHLKLETGMGRTGIDCRNGRDPEKELRTIVFLPGLDIQGAFTHFSVSEDDAVYTRAQFDLFCRTCDLLENLLGRSFLRHCANSGAFLQYPEMHLDLVRPGIALYGALQDKHLPDPGLLPVMTLKTRIVQLHELCQGDSVSYGRCYTADHAAKAAVLPIGYADGLHRSLSGKAKFLLHGIPVPQIGRICMDMCMLCTDPVEDAAVGDEIVIFGKNAPVSSLAEAAGTISYELLCSVSRRVPRIWL